ncbi:MAG: DUF2924 domain-containing protein [Hyphomicrobium sp.]|uniref:DUF2924 domain-containing protein n=1 Tax=Hyphomicrobium sp. TaxID=82 RepID=UPI0039E22DA8
MKSTSPDIAVELSRLEGLTNFELRGEWRRLHGMQPPKSLSRDLLLRGITYKIQERVFGGLPKLVLRRLSGAAPEAHQWARINPKTGWIWQSLCTRPIGIRPAKNCWSG